MEENQQINAWRPKGGRPKTTEENRRDKVVKIRLTASERTALEKKAREAGYQDISSYLRFKVFSQEAPTDHNPKELFHAIDKTGTALKKIGTNINQIARYVHYLEKNNLLHQKTLDAYNHHFQELIEVENNYVKAIRAFLRTTR